MLNPGIPRRVRHCPVLDGFGDTQETNDSARGAKSCDRVGENAVGARGGGANSAGDHRDPRNSVPLPKLGLKSRLATSRVEIMGAGHQDQDGRFKPNGR